jgi:GNAT superfamily N-acetyltransferase
MLLPSHPLLTFRFYQSKVDVPAMLQVHEACRVRDKTDPYSVCYTIPNLPADKYASLMRDVLPRCALIAEDTRGKVVAQGWMEVWGHDERLYLWRVWVIPEWRGQGVGTALFRWGEERARELHAGDPCPALHLANATEGEQEAVSLLANEGYYLSFVSPELAFDLSPDIPTYPPPNGIVLRPLTPTAHRSVARALCEANLSPPSHEADWVGNELQERIDAEEVEWLARVQDSDAQLSPVAWAGDTVAGAYLCRRTGDVGEIAQVAVRAPWRGRGVARTLAYRSLQDLYDAGCITARLFTSVGPDETEPTHGPYAMYRKFGFTPFSRHLRFRKPMTE